MIPVFELSSPSPSSFMVDVAAVELEVGSAVGAMSVASVWTIVGAPVGAVVGCSEELSVGDVVGKSVDGAGDGTRVVGVGEENGETVPANDVTVVGTNGASATILTLSTPTMDGRFSPECA